MEEKKYYISSDGSKKDISEMNTQYLINAVNKKRNTLFECQTSEEVMDQIEMLDQEYAKRVKQFVEKMSESEREA